MTSKVIHTVTLPNGMEIKFECPYFEELVAGPENILGRLPKDLPAHALWYYYILASQGIRTAKFCLVLETELSPKFDVLKARRVLESVCKMYGFSPPEVVRYWEAVEAQRIALGFTENAELPAVIKFRFN